VSPKRKFANYKLVGLSPVLRAELKSCLGSALKVV
jgi:hypothetical protein